MPLLPSLPWCFGALPSVHTLLCFPSFVVAMPGPKALKLKVVGQGGLGYPMDRHTDQVAQDSDPVTASDLAARLKCSAMVKPPCY